MKNSKVIKLILTIILGMAILLTATQVFAIEEGLDLMNEIEDFTPQTTNSTENKNTTGNTTNSLTTNNTSNTSLTNQNSTNNTNSSIYNNTNLPKTGLADSLPVVLLVVAFGISAVYAYNRINYYKNI